MLQCYSNIGAVGFERRAGGAGYEQTKMSITMLLGYGANEGIIGGATIKIKIALYSPCFLELIFWVLFAGSLLAELGERGENRVRQAVEPAVPGRKKFLNYSVRVDIVGGIIYGENIRYACKVCTRSAWGVVRVDVVTAELPSCGVVE